MSSLFVLLIIILVSVGRASTGGDHLFSAESSSSLGYFDMANFDYAISISDIHGDSLGLARSIYLGYQKVEPGGHVQPFETFLMLLTEAIRLEGNVRWSGVPISRSRRVVLIQLGDVIDRGNKSRECLLMLYRAGEVLGWPVARLFGNHELMAIRQAFPGIGPQDIQFEDDFDSNRSAEFNPTNGPMYQYMASTYLGMAFFGDMHSTMSVKDTRNPNTLFVHAGFDILSEDPLDWFKNVAQFTSSDVRVVNKQIRDSLLFGTNEEKLKALDIYGKKESFFWTRDFSKKISDTKLCDERLNSVLEFFNVARIIVGHSGLKGKQVMSRCGGRIVLSDVRISRFMDKDTYSANPMALVIKISEDYTLEHPFLEIENEEQKAAGSIKLIPELIPPHPELMDRSQLSSQIYPQRYLRSIDAHYSTIRGKRLRTQELLKFTEWEVPSNIIVDPQGGGAVFENRLSKIPRQESSSSASLEEYNLSLKESPRVRDFMVHGGTVPRSSSSPRRDQKSFDHLYLEFEKMSGTPRRPPSVGLEDVVDNQSDSVGLGVPIQRTGSSSLGASSPHRIVRTNTDGSLPPRIFTHSSASPTHWYIGGTSFDELQHYSPRDSHWRPASANSSPIPPPRPPSGRPIHFTNPPGVQTSIHLDNTPTSVNARLMEYISMPPAPATRLSEELEEPLFSVFSTLSTSSPERHLRPLLVIPSTSSVDLFSTPANVLTPVLSSKEPIVDNEDLMVAECTLDGDPGLAHIFVKPLPNHSTLTNVVEQIRDLVDFSTEEGVAYPSHWDHTPGGREYLFLSTSVDTKFPASEIGGDNLNVRDAILQIIQRLHSIKILIGFLNFKNLEEEPITLENIYFQKQKWIAHFFATDSQRSRIALVVFSHMQFTFNVDETARETAFFLSMFGEQGGVIPPHFNENAEGDFDSLEIVTDQEMPPDV